MKRGFTLIELIVVLAIVGILTSVVIASYQDAKKKSEEAKIERENSERYIDTTVVQEESNSSENCELYKNRTISNVPVKCASYFGLTK